MAKVKAPKKSPSIYRRFTDKFRKFDKKRSKLLKKLKLQLVVSIYVITIFLILYFSFDLLQNFQRQKEINFQREKIESQIKLWQDISNKFMNYKEAYFKLATLEYELGDADKAKFYLDKALYIDPNFEKARELQNILKNY